MHERAHVGVEVLEVGQMKLVDEDEGGRAEVAHYVGRLAHLTGEGGGARLEAVARGDAREDAAQQRDVRLARRHEAAHVCHQADERRHPEVGALARHVGSGDERKVARRRCVDVVGHERVLAKAVEDGVARLLEHERRAGSAVHAWARPVAARQLDVRAEGGHHVEERDALTHLEEHVHLLLDLLDEPRHLLLGREQDLADLVRVRARVRVGSRVRARVRVRVTISRQRRLSCESGSVVHEMLFFDEVACI
eukprot:scaffold63152_cov67-Phaeocystis_antarctica.AAC.1